MTPDANENDARQRGDLINRTIGLRTLGQIDEVRAQIADWLRAHPDDNGVREVDARLADFAQTLETDSPASYAYQTTVDTQSLREPLPPTGTAARPTTNASAGDESVASEA
jgi:hypothetical protein